MSKSVFFIPLLCAFFVCVLVFRTYNIPSYSVPKLQYNCGQYFLPTVNSSKEIKYDFRELKKIEYTDQFYENLQRIPGIKKKVLV